MNTNNNDFRKTRVESGFQTINVKEIFLKYLHFSWLFILLISISLVIAWLYLRYTIPEYKVSGTMLIRNDNAGRGNSGNDMFADIALFQSNINKQNEIKILQTRSLMQRVVRSLNLQEVHYVVGNVKTSNIYKQSLFNFKLLSITDSTKPLQIVIKIQPDETFRIADSPVEYYYGQTINSPQGSFTIEKKESPYWNTEYNEYIIEWLPEIDAAIRYNRGLSITPSNDQSNVLELAYTTENPRLGADIINELMLEYNSAAIEDKNEINRRIISFIDDRLNLVENQLDSVEQDFQLFKTNRQVINLETQSQIFFNNASALELRIREQQIQSQVVDLLRSYLLQPSNRSSLVPSTLGISDPTLVAFVSAYNALVVERQRQLQTGATLENELIINLDREIESARVKLLENLNNIKKVYNNTLNTLLNEQSRISTAISSIPEKERESRDRARQQEIKQNLYLYLLQKKEESSIAEAATIANSRVLDNALPRPNLLRPLPLRIYGIALIIGLLLPIIIIYILDLFNDKVTTKQDISKATNAPILGEIGHSSGISVLLFPSQSRSVIAEQMRILRSNLKFLLGENDGCQTLMITSSFSGEGKSFISTNLGAALALSGKKTVILEFDLRKPKILAGLGLAKGQGLTNYLVGGVAMDQLPQAVPQIENLHVISCGPVPPNPSEILLTPRIGELFSWLKNKYDFIIIDTAPVGLVSDAMTLSQFADASLFIVRQRYTFKRQLQTINEIYEQKKLPRIGLVINDVVAEGAYGYYGYGGGKYGYGYGYGTSEKSGYFAGNKKKGLKRFLQGT